MSMYRASPPALGAGAAPLRICGAARRVFDEQNDSVRDPAYLAYLSDMVRPYGLSVDAGALGEGGGQSYGDMAEALLGLALPSDEPVDLLVMAFAVPDVMPWRSAASHVSHRCPGSPMAFAVCDCGTTAAFTGLRLIRAHAVGAGRPRALLIVLEQAAIHHDVPGPATMPARHAAVALRCVAAGASPLAPDSQAAGLLDSVRLRAGVDGSAVGGLLSAELAELSAGHEDVTVIAGAGLAKGMLSGALPAAAEVVVAPAGQPCTGVWWEVAGRLSGWAASGRRVLVADYDPLPGSLCLAAIDVAGPSAEPPW
jgi:4-hydroxymandelate oxidase